MTCVTSTRRISGLQQSEQCDGSTQRPEELRTPTARSGISTTKSTFSRSICICNWFIHSMVSSVPFRIMSKCCHEHLMNNVFWKLLFCPAPWVSRVRNYVFNHFAWLTSINSLTVYFTNYYSVSTGRYSHDPAEGPPVLAPPLHSSWLAHFSALCPSQLSAAPSPGEIIPVGNKSSFCWISISFTEIQHP